MENILGVENIFEKKYIKRMETAYADGDQAVVLQISTLSFMNLKEDFYESGLKKDFLMIESTMRRNFVLKKNMRLNM